MILYLHYGNTLLTARLLLVRKVHVHSTPHNQLSNEYDCKHRQFSAVHSMTDLYSHLLTHIYFTFGTLVRTYDSHNANIQSYVFDVIIPLPLQYHLTLTTLACPKRPLTLPSLTRKPRLAKHLSLRLKSTPLTRHKLALA